MFFNENIIFFLLLFTLHLTLSLKSTDFCIPKQKECKGYYDKQQNYQINCESIKCKNNNKFKYECKANHICSNNITECNNYNRMYSFMKILIIKHHIIFSTNHLNRINKFKLFEKNVSDCESNRIFKSDNFCVNGLNCVEKIKIMKSFGNKYNTKKSECKCPANKSFKCEKYCSTDSIACNYIKLNEKKFKKRIKNCGNHNITFHRNYFKIW